jgi:hypothetical protein
MYNDLFILAASNDWFSPAVCLFVVAGTILPIAARSRDYGVAHQAHPKQASMMNVAKEANVKPAMCSECGRRVQRDEDGRLPAVKVCAHCQRLLQALVD